ncbi:MAG: hypothetical protein NTX03_14160 [Bacteroidetes bacterium]|nr:hypothetical protein [Bacteroidota bacterium]
MRTLVSILFVIAFSVSCTKDGNKSEDKNEVFSLDLPSGWHLKNLEGVDTYVGYYQNWWDTISFDCGRMGFKGIDDVQKDANTISFEELKIDNCDAKIVKKKRYGRTYLTAYIDKRDSIHMNRLYTSNPTDEKKIISIFKTHKFK